MPRNPIPGIIGPGISTNDINEPLPDCVRIESPKDSAEMKALLDRIIRATHRNAARVLGEMLAPTPGAQQLATEFAQRLGIWP
jgi:hypothetical protein